MGNISFCHVKIECPDGVPRVCRIGSFPCRIGRLADNDLVLDHSSVSSLHAVLTLVEGGVVQLEDQWSTNGVYCEGRRVSQLVIDRPLRLMLGKVFLTLSPTAEGLEQGGVTHVHKGTVAGSSAVTTVSAGLGLSGGLGVEGLAATVSRRAGSGRGGIVCPHCWHRFSIDEFLFIARHQSLIGDPVLGADAQQRFLPSRFTAEGNALDAAGTSCPDMACPRCHLRIPQAASEMPPLFLSIVGATSSGKSYFLTSMCWELRNTLSREFAISFTDTDAVNNQLLNDFEETIFLNSESDTLVALRKTELQGDLYNQVLLDNMLINLPKPFMFTVMPAEHHPRYSEVREKMSRTLVLYDNAGEHFEPGMDSVDNPTTQHLLHSDTIFFIFDPTKDVRFRRRLAGISDPQLLAKSHVQRQEIILTEMVNRIKKYSGLRAGNKSEKTLLVLVSKCDVWQHLLGMSLPVEPWSWEKSNHTGVLDVNLIKNVSFALRHLLEEICPELVSTAESFAGEVLYLPNSALGHSPELSEENGMIGIYPGDVKPFWVTVPMLYFFYQRGFIPGVGAESLARHPETAVEVSQRGDVYFVLLPGMSKPLQVPLSYSGWQLRCPGTDYWFTVP